MHMALYIPGVRMSMLWIPMQIVWCCLSTDIWSVGTMDNLYSCDWKGN